MRGITLLLIFLSFSCVTTRKVDPCALPAGTIMDMRKYSALSEGIVVDPHIPHSPRQSYFVKDSISFGNFYNQLLIYSYADFRSSRDSIFDELSATERNEMIDLAKRLRGQHVLYAEYEFGWRCNIFRVCRPDDSTRTMFIGLADTSKVQINPTTIQLLCAKPGYFCFTKPEFR